MIIFASRVAVMKKFTGNIRLVVLAVLFCVTQAFLIATEAFLLTTEAHSLTINFSENFSSVTYKDISATTGSWGRSGCAYLQIGKSSSNDTITSVGTSDSLVCGEGGVIANGIYLYGDFTGGVYAPAYADGFVVFDISDPRSVRYLKKCANTESRELVKSGNYLYGPATNGTYIFDVTQSDTMSITGTIWPSSGYMYDAYKSPTEEYVYITEQGGELRIGNVTNKSAPVLTYTIQTMGGGDNYPVIGKDNYVFLGGDTDLLYVYDITNKTNPDTKSYLNMNNPAGYKGIYGLEIQGNYLFVGNGRSGIRVVDVSNPSNPVIVSTLTVPQFPSQGSAGKLLLVNNHLYARVSNYGIWVIDISDTSNLRNLGTSSVTGRNYSVQNRNFYVVNRDSYFSVFETHFMNSGTVVSRTIDDTTLNLNYVKLTANESVPANTQIKYYVTADGGAHWEEVTSGVRKKIDYIGSDARWKAELSTTNDLVTPYLYGVSVDLEYKVTPPTWDNGSLKLKTTSSSDATKFSAILNWDTGTDPDGIYYEAQRKEDDSDWTTVDTTTNTGMTIEGLDNAKKHYFRVRAWEIYKNYTDWSNVANDDQKPDWSAVLNIGDASTKNSDGTWDYGVLLTWDSAEDNTSDIVWYDVQQKNGDNWEDKMTVSSTSAYVKNLSGPEKKYFRARARDSVNNATDWASASMGLKHESEGTVGSAGGTVRLEDYDDNANNDVRVEVPQGAFNKDYKLTILKKPDNAYDIELLEPSTGRVLKDEVFRKPVTLTLTYSKAYLDIQGVSEDDISLLFFDGVKWVQIGGIIDKSNSTVSAKVLHFTEFRIMKSSSSDNIIVGPKNFTPNGDGINDKVYFSFTDAGIVDSNSAVNVFDINGKFIKKISLEGSTAGYWDGRDSNGNLLEAGVYVYVTEKLKKKNFSGEVFLVK